MTGKEKNDENRAIGILDSGVGGLTAAAEVIRRFPNESVIYIGDSANMPYGNRCEKEIIALANNMIRFLEEKNVKIILLACNTISSLEAYLSAKTPLISIVKAGAEQAAENAGPSEKIGLIATKATVNNRAYEKALGEIDNKLTLVSNASSSLPKVIDRHLDEPELLNEKIRECIDPIVKDAPEIKKLILGCSHFPIIAGEISEVYPQLTLLDPAVKQADMLGEYLNEHALCAENDKRAITLYTTAETYEYAAAIKRLNLEVDALIKVEL